MERQRVDHCPQTCTGCGHEWKSRQPAQRSRVACLKGGRGMFKLRQAAELFKLLFQPHTPSTD